MIFDVLDMTATYVQYLALLVRIAPDSLPLFYGDTINVIKYFVLDLIASFSEEGRYSNPLRMVLPEWLPLDVRLQFVIVVAVAPLALATLGFLIVFNKLAYLWFIAVLGMLFCFVFGAILIANKDLYHDHEQPTHATRATLLSVGLPLFLVLSALGVLLLRRVKSKVVAREQRAHDRYVEQELQQQGAKALTYRLVDREHLDVDLLAAERSRKARKKSRIRSLNVKDVCLQAFMAVCLFVGGLICTDAIHISAFGKLQGSLFMTVIGVVFFVLAAFCFLWFILSLFARGRFVRITVGEYLGTLFLSLLIICCSALYTTITTTFVSVLYCEELTCPAGSRPPHTGALFPATAPATAGTSASVAAVGCAVCDVEAYPQKCQASWQSRVCSSTVQQSRLAYDGRVQCSQVDGFYRVSGALMFVVYLLFVPILQLVLACYGVDLLRRRFPLESRVVELFTPLELFYEKVLTSTNDADFMYSAYKPSFRYYRLTFLVQKVIMALVSATTRHDVKRSSAWVGLMLFMVVPILAVVAAAIWRPFSRPTETAFFPVVQALVALFAMVVLIAERTGHRLSYGVGVLLLVLAVVVPVLTLIIGTVLTLRMEQRRYNLLLLRLQLVMSKAAAGTKAGASWTRSLLRNAGRGRADSVVSASGTCDASTLRYNWLERLVLRFVNWLDPEIHSGVAAVVLDDGGNSSSRGGGGGDSSRCSQETRSDTDTLSVTVGEESLNGSMRLQAGAGLSLGGAGRSRASREEAEASLVDELEISTSTGTYGPAASMDREDSFAGGRRRARARAVVLVGGTAEEAEEATRRHGEADRQNSEGVLQWEGEAAAGYWRRCLCCASDDDDDGEKNEREEAGQCGECGRSAQSGEEATEARSGRLFALNGERAALRRRALFKMERQVAEYDTSAYLFVPEAYFLRHYYPQHVGAHATHGRFWTLFADLLRRPAARLPSQDPAVTVLTDDDDDDDDGEGNDNSSRGDGTGSDREAAPPISFQLGAADAPRPRSAHKAEVELTLRRRRALARSRCRSVSEWEGKTGSAAAFTSPTQALSSARGGSTPREHTVSPVQAALHRDGVTPPDSVVGAAAVTVNGGARRRTRRRFLLPDSPATPDGMVPLLDASAVFPDRADTDAFLFDAHALTPRKSDAGGRGHASGRTSLSPSRAGADVRGEARRLPSPAATVPARRSPYTFRTVDGAFDGGEADAAACRHAPADRTTGTAAAEAPRDWSVGGDSACSDDEEDGEEEEEEGRRSAQSQPMTCSRAAAIFFRRLWHGLQEWLGVRHTQDAVLRRLQQRDGLTSRSHTLLTYPVVFRKRQAAGEVRAALSHRGRAPAPQGDGGVETDLPYARPHWRQPSSAMLGVGDVRGSTAPWFLRTTRAPPALDLFGTVDNRREALDGLPSSSLSFLGFIDRFHRIQSAADDAAPAPQQWSPQSVGEVFSIGAEEGYDNMSLGAPPDVPHTQLNRAVDRLPLVNVDAVFSESSDGEACEDVRTHPAYASLTRAEALDVRYAQSYPREGDQPDTTHAASWATYCLAVAEETLEGFHRFWRERGQRVPVTSQGRHEEFVAPLASLPPTDQLSDVRFAKLLQEVLLPDVSSDESSSDSDDDDPSGETSRALRTSDGGSSESLDFDVFASDTHPTSPAVSPVLARTRWGGVNATASRRVTAALVRGGAATTAAATTSVEGSAWKTWMEPGASTAAGAVDQVSACEANAGGDDETLSALLRLLRCQLLLRERLTDIFWSQRRRLRHVQCAVNDKVGHVVRLFLTFLFVWLGLLACVSFAIVFGGMLHTIDTTLITGTHTQRTDVEYQLAGYASWEAFTAHCCCTAAENLNASFPFYALDVENWLCENGKVKERVRRDGFDDEERSGYRVRGLCGMTFRNGCALQQNGDGGVAISGCTLSDIAEYERLRW